VRVVGGTGGGEMRGFLDFAAKAASLGMTLQNDVVVVRAEVKYRGFFPSQ
jgi:hypothetical protein